MGNNTDTKVIDYSQTTRKRSLFTPLPSCIAFAFIIVALIAAVVVWKEIRAKQVGVMEAAYIARAAENDVREPVPTKAPQKCKHVIFRLGDDEIFRFTYEDGGDDMRYSFEVREGGL
jgi:hypothetical protein